MSTFERDAKPKQAAAIEKAALDFAVQQARRYIRFVRKANGFDAARYTMQEYLQKQGVRKDLIPAACRMAEEAYGIA